MSTLIIAEAGVNHNGSLDMALRMVHEAARAGADVVKFQTFRADDLVTRDAPKADYQNEGDHAPSQYEMLRRLELTADDYRRLMDECCSVGIGFMSTPFSIASADLLAGMGMKRWKIPSGELTNLPLLRHIAHLGGTVIMSTGMATLDEVREAVEALVGAGMSRRDIYLMHCTTAYPTPVGDVNLRAMEALASLDVAGVGYSDHTQSLVVPAAAVAMGACMIEKHFTLDRDLPGPDHKASLLPDEFASMVRDIRTVEAAIGQPVKAPTPAEWPNIAVARKSIVAARTIAPGTVFTDDILTTKRPGTGISPMLWDNIIGRTASRGYSPDELISQDELN